MFQTHNNHQHLAFINGIEQSVVTDPIAVESGELMAQPLNVGTEVGVLPQKRIDVFGDPSVSGMQIGILLQLFAKTVGLGNTKAGFTRQRCSYVPQYLGAPL